jgi:hypothetical protein
MDSQNIDEANNGKANEPPNKRQRRSTTGNLPVKLRDSVIIQYIVLKNDNCYSINRFL